MRKLSRQILKYTFLTLAGLAFTGCWVNDLLIRNLDNVIEIKTADTLGLYYKQKQELEKDVSSFLNQSKTLAPQIKQKLSEYQALAASGEIPKARAVAEEMRYWQGLYAKIAKTLIEHHADYVSNLTEKQQEEFFKQLKEKNEEIEEKAREGDWEDYAQGFEFLFGDLNQKQEKFLRQSLGFFKQRSVQRLKRRRSFQENLRELFSKKASEKRFKELMLENVKTRYSSRATAKRAEIITRLFNLAGGEEMTELKENLKKAKNWIDVFVATDY